MHAINPKYKYEYTGRKELGLASLNGNAQGARVHFSRHNSPKSRALANPERVELSGSDPWAYPTDYPQVM